MQGKRINGNEELLEDGKDYLVADGVGEDYYQAYWDGADFIDPIERYMVFSDAEFFIEMIKCTGAE